MKNILAINSSKKFDQSLLELFRDVGGNICLFGWLGEKAFLDKFKEIGRSKRIFFGPSAEKPASFFCFIFFAPCLWIIYFFRLFFFSRRWKIEKIICIGFREKIIFAPLARFLKIAVVWLNLPGESAPQGKISSALLKLFSGSAEIVVFTKLAAADLVERGYKEDQISDISLGANFGAVERQDNIFQDLAKAGKPRSFYKNFTVGAVVGAPDRRRLELLLQATKSCLNFIPNFRLVVIGAVLENSGLNWLVKTMGIENKVWFVGEQKNPWQWFADFDLYVVLQENPGLRDLEMALLAASRGVPIAAFQEKNMSDIISEGQTGFFIEKSSAEALGQKIIEIEANQSFRQVIGENGKAAVLALFDRKKQIARLQEVINR